MSSGLFCLVVVYGSVLRVLRSPGRNKQSRPKLHKVAQHGLRSLMREVPATHKQVSRTVWSEILASVPMLRVPKHTHRVQVDV